MANWRRWAAVIAVAVAACSDGATAPRWVLAPAAGARWAALRPAVIAEAEAPRDIDGPATDAERRWIVGVYEELRDAESLGRAGCPANAARLRARAVELHSWLDVRRLTLPGVGDLRSVTGGPLEGCLSCAPNARVACDAAREQLADAAADMREAGLLPGGQAAPR